MSEKRNISNKLFAELCNHFSNEINSPFEIRTFKKGEFIYRKGNQPKGVYIIKYGWVKIFRGGNEGDEVILRMLGHNEFIGYVSLLKDTPYPDNAHKIRILRAILFPRNVFLTLIHENNDFTRSIIQMLCDEIWSSEKQIVNLHSKKIDSRLATLLLDLEQASENSPVHDDSLIRLPKKIWLK
ncbi:Crp/Fnr family transcriptional regulator [Kaistella anthropi]|nr:Crp/Fnr family transcriptional regulator [Kaistella anthropi]